MRFRIGTYTYIFFILTSVAKDAATSPPETKTEPIRTILRYPILAANKELIPPRIYMHPKAEVPIQEIAET